MDQNLNVNPAVLPETPPLNAPWGPFDVETEKFPLAPYFPDLEVMVGVVQVKVCPPESPGQLGASFLPDHLDELISNANQLQPSNYSLMCEAQTFLSQPTSVFRYPINYQPIYENFSFATSFYTEWNKGQACRKFDLGIRNSVEVEINDQILSDAANQTLRSIMAAIDEEVVITEDKWRVLKYQMETSSGTATTIVRRTPLVHFGTQVWLPRKSICSYKGGVLKTTDKEVREITPSDTEWTLIVLPLGVLHEISQVEFVRISYVKPIYIREKREGYLIPRTSNLGEDRGGRRIPHRLIEPPINLPKIGNNKGCAKAHLVRNSLRFCHSQQ